jgi:hypothetical protein
MTTIISRHRPSIRQRLEAKAKKESAAKKRPGMSEKHLSFIRRLPCCASGAAAPSDPHHLKDRLIHERGVGRKATDRWTVPLSRKMHDELEKLGSRREREWFMAHGIKDPLELADRLWHVSGNLEQMRKVLEAHMGRYAR